MLKDNNTICAQCNNLIRYMNSDTYICSKPVSKLDLVTGGTKTYYVNARSKNDGNCKDFDGIKVCCEKPKYYNIKNPHVSFDDPSIKRVRCDNCFTELTAIQFCRIIDIQESLGIPITDYYLQL